MTTNTTNTPTNNTTTNNTEDTKMNTDTNSNNLVVIDARIQTIGSDREMMIDTYEKSIIDAIQKTMISHDKITEANHNIMIISALKNIVERNEENVGCNL